MEEWRHAAAAQSRRLPPLEAWKRPDLWIDVSTGLKKPDVPKLVLPTDDRGLLHPEEIVDMALDLFFWPDYEWPFNPRDPETAPDDHHFYHPARAYRPENHDSNEIPKRFRELPIHIGTIPRQMHNVLHDYFEQPTMPSMEVMDDRYQTYILVRQIFKRLIETAKKTTDAQALFDMRRRSIELGGIDPARPFDDVGEEFLRSFFAKHFAAYSEMVEAWQALPESEKSLLSVPEVKKYRPHLVVRSLGRVANRRNINFVPLLNAS